MVFVIITFLSGYCFPRFLTLLGNDYRLLHNTKINSLIDLGYQCMHKMCRHILGQFPVFDWSLVIKGGCWGGLVLGHITLNMAIWPTPLQQELWEEDHNERVTMSCDWQNLLKLNDFICFIQSCFTLYLYYQKCNHRILFLGGKLTCPPGYYPQSITIGTTDHDIC